MTYRTLVATSMFADVTRPPMPTDLKIVLRFEVSEGKTPVGAYVKALLRTLLGGEAARIPFQPVLEKFLSEYSEVIGAERVVKSSQVRAFIRWVISWNDAENVERAFLRFHDRIPTAFEKGLFTPSLQKGDDIREIWIGVLMLADFRDVSRNDMNDWIGRCLLGRPLLPHETEGNSPEIIAKRLLYGTAEGIAFSRGVVRILFRSFFHRAPTVNEDSYFVAALRTRSIASVLHELATSDEFCALATAPGGFAGGTSARLMEAILGQSIDE